MLQLYFPKSNTRCHFCGHFDYPLISGERSEMRGTTPLICWLCLEYGKAEYEEYMDGQERLIAEYGPRP